MRNKQPKGWHSRGYLPHFDSPERIQHVVIRTRESLHASALARQDESGASQRRRIDALLDRSNTGRVFVDPVAAQILEDALLHFDGVRYRLLAWCVMPNHAHVVLEQIEGHALGDVVKSWKVFTARLVNQHRNRSGALWANDYFDRFVRDEDHLNKTIAYVENNPVLAHLVASPEQYAFSSARLLRRAWGD